MRIVSGKFRGHSIHAPKNIPARPTTDRSKESLFNILQNRLNLEEQRVLDLFSGTGNMAYEFASRGATLVHAVDQHPAAAPFINETFAKLGYEQGKAFRSGVMPFLKRCRESYSLIFADPPYGWNGTSDMKGRILSGEILEPGGLFILEHAVQFEPGTEQLEDRRVYGQSAFSFYQK